MTAGASEAAIPQLDSSYTRLKQRVIEETGLSFYRDKDDILAQRLARRMQELGDMAWADYLATLSRPGTGDREFDALIVHLTVGETSFFRYPEQFEALKDVIIPECLERNAARRRLRIWSAGCSSGAEPYSLAMLLKHSFGERLAGWDVSIVGTDINRDYLAQAREGCFGDWALRSIPAAFRQACFEPGPGRTMRVLPEYRNWITFAYHNLVKHPVPSALHDLFAFDVILCRNVMIYFSRDVITDVVRQFRNALVEGGWFLTGHAEPTEDLMATFNTVGYPGTTLYRRRGEPAVDDTNILSRIEVLLAPAAVSYTLPDWQPLPQPVAEPAPAAQKPAKVASAPGEEELAMIERLVNAGCWPEARRKCERLREKGHGSVTVFLFDALIHDHLGNVEAAEASLRRALQCDPASALVPYHFGMFRLTHGDRASAATFFSDTLEALKRFEPDHVFAHADGLSARDLKELAEIQLELLEAS